MVSRTRRAMRASTMKERNGTTPPAAMRMKRVNDQRIFCQSRKSLMR